MAKPTPRTSDKTKPPNASMNVIKAWLPRIGSFLKKATHRSRGGGKIKAGTLMISTRISQSTRSARKKSTGSAMFFQDAFTAYLLKESPGRVKVSYSFPQGEIVFAEDFNLEITFVLRRWRSVEFWVFAPCGRRGRCRRAWWSP